MLCELLRVDQKVSVNNNYYVHWMWNNFRNNAGTLSTIRNRLPTVLDCRTTFKSAHHWYAVRMESAKKPDHLHGVGDELYQLGCWTALLSPGLYLHESVAEVVQMESHAMFRISLLCLWTRHMRLSSLQNNACVAAAERFKLNYAMYLYSPGCAACAKRSRFG